MVDKSHMSSRANLKKIITNSSSEDLRTCSIDTSYEQGIDKMVRTETIGDNMSINTEDDSLNQDSLDDYTIYFSKILSYLFSKAENLESDSKVHTLLNVVFSDFCNIEHQYVQKLKALGERIDLTSGVYSKDSLPVLSSFKNYIKRLTDNHLEFMDSLASECLIESTNQVFYEINKKINKLRRELETYKSDRLSYISGMKQTYIRAKNAVSVCLRASHQTPTIKTSFHKTSIPVILNFINITNLVDKTDEFNYFVDFSNRVDEVVRALVELDNKKTSEITGVLSKFVVYETAKLRNLQYDLNKLIETLNKQEPIANLKEEYDNKQKDLMPKMGQSRCVEFDQEELEQDKNEGYTTASIQPPSLKVIKMIENKMERFIECIWGERQVGSLMEFSEEIQSSLVRQIFCDMLLKNAAANAELESTDKFQLLADMVNLVLLVSERQSDYWSGYSVIKFSDKFYTPVNSPKDQKCYLWAMISTNSYWKNRKFWEECLTIVISMDLKELFHKIIKLNRGVKKVECVPTTEDPLLFQERMFKYGIPATECEDIVNRVCKRLKMPQTYVDSLIQI